MDDALDGFGLRAGPDHGSEVGEKVGEECVQTGTPHEDGGELSFLAEDEGAVEVEDYEEGLRVGSKRRWMGSLCEVSFCKFWRRWAWESTGSG